MQQFGGAGFRESAAPDQSLNLPIAILWRRNSDCLHPGLLGCPDGPMDFTILPAQQRDKHKKSGTVSSPVGRKNAPSTRNILARGADSSAMRGREPDHDQNFARPPRPSGGNLAGEVSRPARPTLTEKGRAQATALGKRIHDEWRPAAIYTGPLQRA